MHCAHATIEAALDRWTECHWHIHQMEAQYHTPELFRFCLNSFIRAVKEVPQILSMELQNEPTFQTRIKPLISTLRNDPLMALLSKKRDFVVHRGKLDVLSKGSVAATEGRMVKISFGFHVAPWETTDEVYERFKEQCRQDRVWRQMAGPDCDSWPMIRREWYITEFPTTELLELAIDAWRVVGATLSEIVIAQSGEPLDLSFSCRHDPEKIKVRHYSQSEFFASVDGTRIDA